MKKNCRGKASVNNLNKLHDKKLRVEQNNKLRELHP
jgi:hypothetical protein